MKKKNWLTILVAAAILLLAFPLVSACKPAEVKVERYEISAGTVGGSFYVWSVTIANALNRYMENVEWSVHAGTYLVNPRRIDAGKIKGFGLSNPSDFFDWRGELPTITNTNIRQAWSAAPSWFFLMIDADKPWKTIKDIPKGAKIAAGGPGTTTRLTLEKLMEVNGLNLKDYTLEAYGTSAANEAWRDGKVDVIWRGTGMPGPSIAELLTMKRQIKLIGAGKEEVDKYIAKYPVGAVAATLPAGTQKGIDYDVYCINTWSQCFTHKDLPEDTLYQVAKVLDEHYDELVATYPLCKWSTAENVVKYSAYPLHPGLERYLRDTGYLK